MESKAKRSEIDMFRCILVGTSRGLLEKAEGLRDFAPYIYSLTKGRDM